MTQQKNPLTGYFRTPKLYVNLPTQGKFYHDDVIDWPETGELAVYAMTAKDELIMKNPDALLNGEAVASVLCSCVPAIKKPRSLVGNDVEVLLIAIQSATYGDEVTIKEDCPKCKTPNEVSASIDAVLSTMTILEKSYIFETLDHLVIEVRPFSYESTVKAGISSFKSVRSLQALAQITDEFERLRTFSENFNQIAALNFELLIDSVASVKGKSSSGEPFLVTDRKNIAEFLENCDADVGKMVESKVAEVNKIGINRTIGIKCTNCNHDFSKDIGFDPVNFSMPS